MEKIIASLLFAVLASFAWVCPTKAQSSTYNEEDPGGWDFTGPCLTVSKRPGNAKFHVQLGSSFAFGFISGVKQDEGVSIDMGQSYEMHWDNVISTRTKVGHHGLFRAGIGFDWRNYRMINGNIFSKDETGHICIVDGTPVRFSRIHTFSLSFPLKYYYQLAKHTYVAIGPELYFTPHASMKTRYDSKNRIVDNYIHHNRFSMDLGAEFMVNHVGIYYKYNPFSVLNTDFGPKFQSMTVGVKLNLYID